MPPEKCIRLCVLLAFGFSVPASSPDMQKSSWSIGLSRAVAICLLIGPLLVRPDNAPDTEGSERRAALLKKFDTDGNGRLSDAEREVMRKEIFEQRRRSGGEGRGRMMFQFPPEIVKKYDRNGDGQLDEEEAQAAREGMRKIFEELQRKYDANHNGRIDPEEMEKVRADAAAGKLEGVPQFFLRMGPRRGPGFGGRGTMSDAELFRRMDANHDGRLSVDELQALRAEREKLRRQVGRPASESTQ